ncbi:hypothetical protein [Streptomyces bungoensis]|uniref:hypothetical protein n=1 Tax=Streptomyces bungoensis TaxID=285568 RepID=UPI000AE38814|nr:hypothetical protein [Streptomyces bungoensis]
MTTATARVRIAAAAAGLVGALALTACSGGGSPDDSSADSTATAAASSSPTAGSTGTVTGSSGKLQGSWVTTSKGAVVALVITGGKAGLFGTGGTVCSGTAGSESGMRMIHLTCSDGNKDRVTGMVDSVTKDGMRVTWSGKLGQETYTKAEGGKLPSGLPTAIKQ